MTTRRSPGTSSDGLPWPSLAVLGAATFTMVTAEMLPTAVLPQMSSGLGVTEARTGMLVSVWAAVVVVASFPLVRLVAGRDRRSVIAAALTVLAASSVATALAPSYGVAVGARLAGAAAVGLLWATANAHVADLVPDRLLARSVAVVLGGATLGMVLGTPLASLVTRVVGWRAAFAGLAVLTLVVAVLVRSVVARASAAPAGRGGAGSDGADGAGGAVRPAGARGPGAMIAVTATVGVLLVGHYGAYTYVTRIVETPASAVPGGVSTLLLVFGLASALGVVLAGRFGARTAPALALASAGTALALLALTAVGARPALGVAVLVLWGVASGALPPLAQTLILRLGGPERRATAGALIPVVFNGGIAVGAALASVVVARGGALALPVPAAVVVAATTVALVAGARAWSRPAGVDPDPARRLEEPVRR
ncbi:MFS transporter [Krasilnikoviella flava]|uniref:Predicted arabinose efflux permease, MFS family n=1 Tax=Krasilnikoviella flava TaxID=526729 RepID=A0A1T5LS26_9MICO|nr:MFS transporter [Krasilnikoviella flava]SKC78776.1 Predicted arabinose efflux permease, MFS family [Krasilnikoviella flava]